MSTLPDPTPGMLDAIFGSSRYRTRQQMREALIAMLECSPAAAEAAIDRCWRDGWLFAAVFTVLCRRTGRLRLATWFRPGPALVESRRAGAATATVG